MISRLPSLNALRAFEAAARTGSFKEAADILNVSQSAVSHQIKKLEEALGIELFQRKPRSVQLTDAGREYYPFVEHAFAHIAEGTRLISQRLRDDVLTVQTYSTFAVRWLLPRLADFHGHNKELRVRLTTSQWDPDFTKQDIDLAIMIGAPASEGLTSHYLFSPNLFPVCSPTLLEGEAALSRAEDLAGHTLLQVYPSAQDWPMWLRANGVAETDLDTGVNFDSYDHALKTASRGLGIALAMHPYVAEDFASGELVQALPGSEVCSGRSWFLVYPEGRAHLRKVQSFHEWLEREVANDPNLSPLRREPPSEH
ncbi:MAG: transcriptional regulator GcvA [Pseudomonadota bacterium]